jgi:hypothetical protein
MPMLPLSTLLDLAVPINSLSLVADNPKSQLHPVSLQPKPQLPGCPPPLVGSTASPPLVSKSRKRANARSRITYQAKGSPRLPRCTRDTSFRRSESYNAIAPTNPRSKPSRQRSPSCGTDINDRWSSTTNSLRRVVTHDGVIHTAAMSAAAAILPADQSNSRWASNAPPPPPPPHFQGCPSIRRGSRKSLQQSTKVGGRAPSSNTMSLENLLFNAAAAKKSSVPALRSKPVRKTSKEALLPNQEDGIKPPRCISSPVRLPIRRKSRDKSICDVFEAALDSPKTLPTCRHRTRRLITAGRLTISNRQIRLTTMPRTHRCAFPWQDKAAGIKETLATPRRPEPPFSSQSISQA